MSEFMAAKFAQEQQREKVTLLLMSKNELVERLMQSERQRDTLQFRMDNMLRSINQAYMAALGTPRGQDTSKS